VRAYGVEPRRTQIDALSFQFNVSPARSGTICVSPKS
jgi:hypothetical protein